MTATNFTVVPCEGRIRHAIVRRARPRSAPRFYAPLGRDPGSLASGEASSETEAIDPVRTQDLPDLHYAAVLDGGTTEKPFALAQMPLGQGGLGCSTGMVFLITGECGVEDVSAMPGAAGGGSLFVIVGQPSPESSSAPRSGHVLPGTRHEVLRFVHSIVGGRSAEVIALAREAAARQSQKAAEDIQRWIEQVVDDVKDAND